MSESCPIKKDTGKDMFASFSSTLLKSFFLMLAAYLILLMKVRLIAPGQVTVQYLLAFIIIASLLLGILGMVDSYVFNNIAIGMGITLGYELLHTGIKVN